MNAIELLKHAAREARDLIELAIEDPGAAKEELRFRCALFLAPPKLVADRCPNGCCGAIHVHDEVSEEFLFMVQSTAEEMRIRKFGEEIGPQRGIS